MFSTCLESGGMVDTCPDCTLDPVLQQVKFRRCVQAVIAFTAACHRLPSAFLCPSHPSQSDRSMRISGLSCCMFIFVPDCDERICVHFESTEPMVYPSRDFKTRTTTIQHCTFDKMPPLQHTNERTARNTRTRID